jgi:choline monooxygenase
VRTPGSRDRDQRARRMCHDARVIDPDIRSARTLPASFYRDAAVFERVREHVFARSWQLVLDAAEATQPGSVKPFSFLEGCVDEPLLLSRDEAGTVRALSNVCTHRGNLLCTKAETGAEHLRCRYHGRRFALDGRFLSMPEFEGVRDFPSPADDLPRVELNQLGPLLFTSLHPSVSFEEWIAPVRKQMAFLPLEKLAPDPSGSRTYEIAANWALYCDNYLEGFHVPYVHGALAKTIDYGTYRTELFAWSSLQIAEAAFAADAFDGTSIAAIYFFLFPNTMLNFYPWGLSINVVVPLAVDRTRIVYRTLVLDPAKRGRGAGGDLDRVEHEDEEIVEQVQRGIRSRLYDRGRYSPLRETGVHHFHQLLTRFAG